MGTIADKLQKVIDTKAAIKQAIENKGVEVADDATFAEYATTLDDAVITPLGQLGYSAEDEAVYADVNFNNGTLRSDLKYSNSLKGTYFASDTKLKYLPFVDVSKKTILQSVFSGCSSLITIPQLDVSKSTNFYMVFKNCSSLIAIPQLNTSRGQSFAMAFSGCTSLVSIRQIDFSSCSSCWSVFQNCTSLQFCLIKNVGAMAGFESIPFAQSSHYGEGSDENRQSLVDTLLTYSYDRAAAGMETCTVTLAAAVKARLTDEEIAAITAKGYTLA